VQPQPWRSRAHWGSMNSSNTSPSSVPCQPAAALGHSRSGISDLARFHWKSSMRMLISVRIVLRLVRGLDVAEPEAVLRQLDEPALVPSSFQLKCTLRAMQTAATRKPAVSSGSSIGAPGFEPGTSSPPD
jgi:hypothetical protein